jgi:hypothetical protein
MTAEYQYSPLFQGRSPSGGRESSRFTPNRLCAQRQWNTSHLAVKRNLEQAQVPWHSMAWSSQWEPDLMPHG